MKKGSLFVVATVAAATLCAACSSGGIHAPSPRHGTSTTSISGTASFTINGTVDIVESESALGAAGSSCAADPASRAVEGPGVIVVTSRAGKRIAVGALEGGTVIKNRNGCQLDFAVAVPALSSYGVALGDHGTVVYTRAQLESAHWRVSFSLG
jgi:hypothetical protein